MDWINCNICCRQPGDEKERMFMLSSCGHIFCDLCLAQAKSKDKCKICAASCQLIQLSSKMSPDTEMYFQEPAELLKKHNAQLNRLLEFQKEHRYRLVLFHRKMLLKYKELQQKFRMAAEKIHQLEKENMKLKEIINSGTGEGGRDYSLNGKGDIAHNLYKKAITASVLRNSPQERMAQYASPNCNRISPTRMTLLKCKTPSTPNHRNSPNNSLGETRSAIIHRTMAKGGSPSHLYHTTNSDSSNELLYSTDLSRGASPTLKNVLNENYLYNRSGITYPQPSLLQSTGAVLSPHARNTFER